MILETRPDLEADFLLGSSGINYPDVSTAKEADAFLRITGQEFPFFVFEPKRDLRRIYI